MRLALWMYEGTAHHGVGRVANSMRGVHAVFHAPQGDDYVVPIFTMLERTPDFPRMSTSVVSGRDLAQGTIRLPETLRQVEAALHPELILVCASCSTMLLQEDLQAVADSAQTTARTLVVDANPYKMQEHGAAELVLTRLVREYARPQPLTEQPSVNILGPISLGFHVRSDVIWLRRALAALGVLVNVVAPLGADLGDLARLPAAWVNLAPYRELGQGAGCYLEEQFGTPLLDAAPIGVQPTLVWLRNLIELLNRVGAQRGAASSVRMPPLTAFSLDGMSAPSSVPWFARTADMESFSSKRAFVFGDATHTVGVARFLADELGMQIIGAGTYLLNQADWVRGQLAAYLPHGADDFLATDRFQDVAARIAELQPDLVCGTQMERHSCRKHELACMVIAPPTHIENHLLGYRPILGFDGADVLADTVYTTTRLGLEQHLIDMFGDAGLEYEEPTTGHPEPIRAETVAVERQVQTDVPATAAAPAPPATPAVREVIDPATVVWTAEAQGLLKKVPFFVRGRVQKNTEKWAAGQGFYTITADVMHAAREALGG